MQKHQTNFWRVGPFNITLLKEHTGRIGIFDHCTIRDKNELQ